MRAWSWGSRRCWLRDSASLREVSGGLHRWVGAQRDSPMGQSGTLNQTMIGMLA